MLSPHCPRSLPHAGLLTSDVQMAALSMVSLVSDSLKCSENETQISKPPGPLISSPLIFQLFLCVLRNYILLSFTSLQALPVQVIMAWEGSLGGLSTQGRPYPAQEDSRALQPSCLGLDPTLTGPQWFPWCLLGMCSTR